MSQSTLTKPRSLSEAETASLMYLSFVREVEDFLYAEADTIDDRRFKEWLTFFSDDVRYWMPLRKNMAFREHQLDITGPSDIAWFDDDKVTLTKRVDQILTGVHWAEEPLSRVSHLISNIRLMTRVTELSEGDEVDVSCHFLVHRNRLEVETDLIAGRRFDRLRRVGDSFQIASRKIVIDQSTLLAKNLTFFL